MTINTIVQNTCRLFFAVTFLSGALYGENAVNDAQDELVEVEILAEQDPQEILVRAIVGERALSEEEMEVFEAERAIKAIDAKPLEEEHVSKPLYQSSHPGAFQSIFWFSSYERKIELKDRSVWHTQGDYNFGNWRRNDVIMISQSGHFQYPYCLTNQRTSEYVLAQLALGPDLSSFYRLGIKAIYPDDGYIKIKLTDGSRWLMSSLDYFILTGWSIGDTIIIGINTDVWNSQGNNILINVTTNNKASGSCVRY